MNRSPLPACLRCRLVARTIVRALAGTVVALSIAACGGARAKASDDRDRGLSDQPLRSGVDGEPLVGDLGVGVAAVRNEDCDAAVPALERHLVAQPRSALAWYHIGLCRLADGQERDARLAFEKAWALNPQLHGAANNLGALYLKNGEDIAALRVLQQAAEVAPDDARVLVNLGVAYLRRGLWSEAVESFRAAAEVAPGVGSVLYDQALALMVRHEYALALQVADAAVLARPRMDVAHAARIVCLHELGRLDEAETAAAAALAELGGSPDLWVVQARLHIARGRPDEAEKALQQALALDAEHPRAQQALGELLDAAGRKADAVPWYARYLKNPGRTDAEMRRIRERLKQLQVPKP
ncbi:MAG: tetratricopeptide repeat protein [Myxococcales bacterium]|nr:tetratricopeptide repeat protein [Myxococcales bacterium]